MHIAYHKIIMPIMCAAHLISEKLANMHELEINVVDTKNIFLKTGQYKKY